MTKRGRHIGFWANYKNLEVYLSHICSFYTCLQLHELSIEKCLKRNISIFKYFCKVKSPHIHRSYLPWTQHSPPFTVHSMYYILMIMRSLCNFTQSMFWYPPWQYMHCIDLCLSCQLLPCVQSLVCNVFYELQCARFKADCVICIVQYALCNEHNAVCRLHCAKCRRNNKIYTAVSIAASCSICCVYYTLKTV